MPILSSKSEMDELAQKLAKMNINRARGTIRSLDKQTRIELFRVSVGTNQWITRYGLPNKGLWITLVEQKEEYGTPDGHDYRKTRFKYVEARVEALPDQDRRDFAYRVPEPFTL